MTMSVFMYDYYKFYLFFFIVGSKHNWRLVAIGKDNKHYLFYDSVSYPTF